MSIFSNPLVVAGFVVLVYVMLLWDRQGRSLYLVEFDMVRAIVVWQEGLPVVPVWLDVIHHQLEARLKDWGKLSEALSKLN